MALLESIAFQIARGWARGTVEGIAACLVGAQSAVDEAPGDIERRVAVSFRDAVQRVSPAGRRPIAEYSPQDSAGN